MTVYSDITPRTNAYADAKLLTRAQYNNILGQFGQVRVMPKRKTKTIIFRRYDKIDSTPVTITEGVTPTGKTLANTDVTATVAQYGDYVVITDVIMDTHEDPVLNETIDICAEQAAEMLDKIRAGVLKAGTNKMYSNGSARTDVNTYPSRATFRTAIRTLKAQHAKPLRELVQAGIKVSTKPIPPSYVAVCHSDLQPDLEQMEGWIPIEQYSSQQGMIEGEIGSVGEIRFVVDNNLTAWADGGGAYAGAGYSTITTTGASSDVYPILIFGKDAYGIVPLAGKESVETIIRNPKADSNDPLAQRGSVGWKTWTAAVILNDLWMLRVECAARG